MLSYIPERSRSEKSIHDRMQQHIRIGMSDQSVLIRYLNSAYNKLTFRAEPVNVIARSYSHILVSRS